MNEDDAGSEAGPGRDARPEDPDLEPNETDALLASGAAAGNRGGALAFFALMVVVGAGLFFYLSSRGAGAFVNRLDASLLAHAELSLAAMDNVTVAPSWPIALYERLRADMLFYAGLAALAAYLWSLAARSRARRDAFLVHQRLRERIDQLEKRLALLEPDQAPEASAAAAPAEAKASSPTGDVVGSTLVKK
ncbi:MAG: hypothetical protein LIQ31_10960 [Planctomycetes bacterium]|nr:hypothetical protein [Planctomycetota bacterium]